MEHESDGDADSNWYTRNDLQKLNKGAEEKEIGRRAEIFQVKKSWWP